jgi:hypothetical protein
LARAVNSQGPEKPKGEVRRRGRMKMQSTKGFRAIKEICLILLWWIYVIIHFSKPIDCTAPRGNPNINQGQWMIMMCQCRFVIKNKCTAQPGTVTHTCNPSYIGGRDQEDHSLRSAWAKS